MSKKDDWSEEEDGPTKKMKRGETVVARGGAKDGGGRERAQDEVSGNISLA